MIPETDLAVGELGEDRVHEYFSRWYEVEYVGRNTQRQGVDAIYENRQTGERFAVEVKTDERSGKTGNVFIETVSVFQDNRVVREGWAYTCKADRLLIWLPKHCSVLVLRPSAIAGATDHWREIHRERRVPNDGYETLGLAIPIPEVEQIADDVRRIS